MFNTTPRPLYPRESVPVPTHWETGWAPEMVRTLWTKEKFPTPIGIRTPNRPAHSVVPILATLLSLSPH
jgi:hypothetical protein